MDEQAQSAQIQIKASDEDLKGRYSNAIEVAHTNEEFVLNFFLTLPPTGELVSRILMSPSHMKRLARVINETLEKFEKHTGQKVEEAEEPENIGFKP